jgi:hypothetical protein
MLSFMLSPPSPQPADPGITSSAAVVDARMGAAPMDLGVWKLEQVGASPVRDEFIRLCEDLWKEKTYTRYAIPEVRRATGCLSLGDTLTSHRSHRLPDP